MGRTLIFFSGVLEGMNDLMVAAERVLEFPVYLTVHL